MTFSAPIVAPIALQPDRVGDRAGGDDRALPDHQPRHRGDRADPAGVGQRQVGAGQVVGGQRVRAGLLDERVVGVEELLEVQRPASRITGTISVRVPSFFSTSTARPRLTAPSSTRCGLPSSSAKWWAITGMSSVATRAIAYAIRWVNETRWPASLSCSRRWLEGGHRERAERGRGRDRAALVHVAGERGRAALDQLGAGGLGRGRRGGVGGAVAVAPLPPLALAASTSALVIRPPRALP